MNKNAFTLIEMIVAITLSMVLMVSVGSFVGNGISSITKQKKILDNSDSFMQFFWDIKTSFTLWDTQTPYQLTDSGSIFKVGQRYDSWGFAYLGSIQKNNFYCGSGSEIPTTNHLFLTSFIPFEENGENIISDFASTLSSKQVTFAWETYTTYQKDHQLRDNSGNIVLGKAVFWNKIVENQPGTNTYLNTPTGIATDGNYLFVSDTGNNRILALDSSLNVTTLLDKNDGLSEPTGLFYDTTENILYIANSAPWEILAYSARHFATTPELIYTHTWSNINFNKLELTFFRNDQNQNISAMSESDFQFSGISKNADYSYSQNNILKYYFLQFGWNSSQGACITSWKIDNSGNPINCTSSGTGQTSTPQSKNISAGDSMTINNLNIPDNGNHYYKIDFYNNTTLIDTKYQSYFTQWDDGLITRVNNSLEVVQTGLDYPTGIWGSNNGDWNEFAISTRDFSSFRPETTGNNSSILASAIKSVVFWEDSQIFHMQLEYFKSLNCYNPDEQSIRHITFTKNIK